MSATGERMGASYLILLERMYRASHLFYRGRFAQAQELSAKLAASAGGSPRMRLSCLFYSAWSSHRMGDWKGALEQVEEAARTQPPASFLAPILAVSIPAKVHLGQMEEAREVARRCREMIESPSFLSAAGIEGLCIRLSLAEGFFLVGERDLARSLLSPAIKEVRRAADDFVDPAERALLLACPMPWQGIIELGRKLELDVPS